MKVLAALILTIGSAVALGSGPYLPSGWKPQGPAFYLPSEDQKPVQLKDAPLQGSEASGSDFLREYGPPKIQVSEEIKVQSLPDVVTEQSFVVLEAKFGEDEDVAIEVATEAADLKAAVEQVVPVTESQVEEQSVFEEIQGKSLNIEVAASEAENEAAIDAVEVEAVEQGIKNIAEAIVNLEKEVIQEQISQDITELKTIKQTSGSLDQVPEGFLEYGPPGFREYGPPTLNAALRNSEELNTETEKISTNEARRRRFSPKFRSAKKLKH